MPYDVMEKISPVIFGLGFINMNESKKFLKKLFQDTSYLYKFMSDKSIMVIKCALHYRKSEYGDYIHYTTISLEFKSIVNDEKSLKALNIIEAVNIEQLSEGIFDRFKRITSNKPKTMNKNNNYISDDQYDLLMNAAKEFFNKYLPIFADIAYKEIGSSDICKKNFGITSKIIDEDDINISKNYVSICFLSYSLWDIEPKARTDYDTSSAIKEAQDIHEKILKAIKDYCSKNNISMKFEYTGDWDDVSEDIYISTKSINLPLKENTIIFESVEFI